MSLVRMTARYRSKCEDCGEWIAEDDSIFWDGENRVAYCEGCAAAYEDGDAA